MLIIFLTLPFQLPLQSVGGCHREATQWERTLALELAKEDQRPSGAANILCDLPL